MKLAYVFAAAFVTVVLGLAVFGAVYAALRPQAPPALLAHPASEPAPAFTPTLVTPEVSAPIPLPPPVLSALPWDDNRALANKDNMLERCHVLGGIAVMGFGWRVVCLKPQYVEWVDDPHNPKKEKK